MDYLARARQYRAKKRLGQNFLVNENILNLIVSEANIQPDETILEIGAGTGFLTELIAAQAQKVIAVEIDPKAVEILQEYQLDNLDIIQQDVLKLDFSTVLDKPVKILANIPYYITTPILLHLFGDIDEFDKTNRKFVTELIIMVQKEVGDRLVATPESKNKQYGSITLVMNYWAEIEFIKDVPSSAFWPRPKVDSILLRLKPRTQPPVQVQDTKTLKKVIKAAFTFRRKNLKNALSMSGFSGNIIMNALDTCAINENTRGETLSLSKFAELSDAITSQQTREK